MARGGIGGLVNFAALTGLSLLFGLTATRSKTVFQSQAPRRLCGPHTGPVRTISAQREANRDHFRLGHHISPRIASVDDVVTVSRSGSPQNVASWNSQALVRSRHSAQIIQN